MEKRMAYVLPTDNSFFFLDELTFYMKWESLSLSHILSVIKQACLKLMEVREARASLSRSGFLSHQLCVSALSRSDHKECFRRERHADTQESQREETVINLFLSSGWGDRANESPARGSWTDISGSYGKRPISR